MRSSTFSLAFGLGMLALLGGVVTAAPAEGQLLKRLTEKAAQAVEKRITGSAESVRQGGATRRRGTRGARGPQRRCS